MMASLSGLTISHLCLSALPSERKEVPTTAQTALRRKARFILPGWVSRFWSIRLTSLSLPAHPTGAPLTGGLGPGPDMEAARDLTALRYSCLPSASISHIGSGDKFARANRYCCGRAQQNKSSYDESGIESGGAKRHDLALPVPAPSPSHSPFHFSVVLFVWGWAGRGSGPAHQHKLWAGALGHCSVGLRGLTHAF